MGGLESGRGEEEEVVKLLRCGRRKAGEIVGIRTAGAVMPACELSAKPLSWIACQNC